MKYLSALLISISHFKVHLRSRIRQMMETLTFPLEQPYIDEVVKELNRVFGDRAIWRLHLHPIMADYFGVKFVGVRNGAAAPHDGDDYAADQDPGGQATATAAAAAAAAEDYEDVMGGSSQGGGGSLSSSGVSEKQNIVPRSRLASVSATTGEVADGNVPEEQDENDSGEDAEEAPVVASAAGLPRGGVLATLRRTFGRQKPSLEPDVVVSIDETADPAPALPPPPIDDPFGVIHQMPAGTSLLLMRVVAQMGLAFSERVTKQIRISLERRQTATLLTKRQPFDIGDLQELGERVKPLNIIPEAQGYVCVHQAKHAITVADELHYYSLAISSFNEALSANTVSKSLLRSYAGALMDMELAAGKELVLGPNSQGQRIMELYQEALRYDQEDAFTLSSYGRFLAKCGRVDDAKLAYLRAILSKPNDDSVQCYCLLVSPNLADEMFEAWKQFQSRDGK